MEELHSREQVEQWLKENGHVLLVRSNSIQAPPESNGLCRELVVSEVSDSPTPQDLADYDGIGGRRSGVFVPNNVFDEMQALLGNEDSTVRRLSSWPITRAFVYVDISDFSQMKTGVQQLVVNSLIHVAKRVQCDASTQSDQLEAELCIGDGYIYVWKTAGEAARFAANLAIAIEKRVAEKGEPEFHFRIGAHVDKVRCFWDPGRGCWNYVGHGINGGNRVLSAIGKEVDDIVFFSAQLRSALVNCGTAAGNLLPCLHNKGRRPDKHKNLWRVYEVNHSAKPYF